MSRGQGHEMKCIVVNAYNIHAMDISFKKNVYGCPIREFEQK